MDTNVAGSTGVQLDDFVGRLITEKGLDDLPTDTQTQVRKDLHERLHDTIAAKVISQLSEADVDAFSALLDKNPSSEEIVQFIESHIEKSSEFLADLLLNFRKTYLGIV